MFLCVVPASPRVFCLTAPSGGFDPPASHAPPDELLFGLRTSGERGLGSALMKQSRGRGPRGRRGGEGFRETWTKSLKVAVE